MSTRTYSCRMCEVSFREAESYRKHAKEKSHVERLQNRVEAAGTSMRAQDDVTDASHQSKPWNKASLRDMLDDGEATESDDNEADADTPQFMTEQCLFCSEKSTSFDANIAHMSTSHSLKIPYQSSLAVDLETLMWYLHLVIFGYRECISCGTRRATYEAVQQHMVGKGHCRFEPTGEFADFYDASLKTSENVDGYVRPDETSLRLPSGKILSHRSHSHTTTGPHVQRQESEPSPQLADSNRTPSQSKALQKAEKTAGAIAMQISRLSVNDQKSLMHLPTSEQRSVLATKKKQLDMAQRQERRARARVERIGNKTLMHSFKPDNPAGRANG